MSGLFEAAKDWCDIDQSFGFRSRVSSIYSEMVRRVGVNFLARVTGHKSFLFRFSVHCIVYARNLHKFLLTFTGYIYFIHIDGRAIKCREIWNDFRLNSITLLTSSLENIKLTRKLNDFAMTEKKINSHLYFFRKWEN